MSEKTLLKELEKDKEKLAKEKFESAQSSYSKESVSSQSNSQNIAGSENASISSQAYQKQKEEKSYQPINIFSSSAFNESSNRIFDKIKSKKQAGQDVQTDNDPGEQAEEIQVQAKDSSQVIEKPNYDLLQTLSPEEKEKIFIFEEEKVDSKPKPKKNKIKIAIVAILFAIFGVWGIVNIASLDAVNTQYSINLVSYLNNLHNIDATNGENMENLFQTLPDESVPPNTLEKQSNWFDRFCDFIAGLFGG